MKRPVVFVGYDVTHSAPNGPERIGLEISRHIKSGAMLADAILVQQRVDPTLLAAHVARGSAGHNRSGDYNRMLLFGPAAVIAYGGHEASLVFPDNPFEKLASLAYASNIEATDLADHLYFAMCRARRVVHLANDASGSLERLVSRPVTTLPYPAFAARPQPGAPISHVLVINHGWPGLQAAAVFRRLREKLPSLVVRITPTPDHPASTPDPTEAHDDCVGRALHLHLGAALNETCPHRLIDSWAAGAPVIQFLQAPPHCETTHFHGGPGNAPYVAHRRSGMLCDSFDAAVAHIRHLLDDAVTLRALVRGGQEALESGEYSAQALIRELAQ